MVAKGSNPLVSIVILNWNGLEDTKTCLDSVFKLDYQNFEVILLDNGSSIEQKSYLSKLDNIIYVDNKKNTGFAGGHNDALPYTSGEFILLLNNDAVISPDYIKKALPIFDNKKVAVVGGRSYFWNENEPLFDNSNRFYSYLEVSPISAETTLLMHDSGKPQVVNTVSGSSVIIRREVINEVGYLYRTFFAYYEESDLFARIKRAGYDIVYSPELHVWHKNGASSGAQGGSSFFFYHIFRNRFIYAVRNFEKPYLGFFLKDYTKRGVAAIVDMPSGSVQRRLGWSYLRAILYCIVHLPPIIASRRSLKKKLPLNYCEQAISEQVTVSYVIDMTSVSQHSAAQKRIGAILKKTKSNAEFIVIIQPKLRTFFTDTPTLRYVTDNGYFGVNPLNIGCLVSRNKWLILSESDSLPSVESCITAITQHEYRDTVEVIDIDDQSIALSKTLFQDIGGVKGSLVDGQSPISFIRMYAEYTSTLHSKNTLYIPNDINKHHMQDLYSKVIEARKSRQQHSLWYRLTSRYYRLHQLSNLVLWLSYRSIPVRLKLARVRNLFLFTLRLDKKSLATELRHIQNERKKYSAPFVLDDKQGGDMAQIENFTKNNISSIPVFIICFERLNDLKKLVSWLESIGMMKIIFIDNDSSYPPLLEYLNTTPYQVLKLYRNVGHTAPWDLDIVKVLTEKSYYIVTDPDIIPINECPEDVIKYFLDLHKKYPYHKKVGFGLRIDDLPSSFKLKNDVIAWEKQFWRQPLESGIYEAGIDTTFALYKPFTYAYTLHPSIRTSYPYIARHMPWYYDAKKVTPEDTYYKYRASSNVTSWNVDELPERYKKEINYEKK